MKTCRSHPYSLIQTISNSNRLNSFIILLLTVYFQNPTYGASVGCSLDELSNCFYRVFGQFNRSRIFNCDDFRIFRYCYDNPACTGNQTSAVASKIYLQTTSIHLPKEFFSALYSQWNSRCNRKNCERFDESNCRKNMQPHDKDFDHALLLEWHGQRLQFELGMVPTSRGCTNLRITMSRWHLFRLSKCPAETALCYCRDQQNRLDSCSLNCNALSNASVLTCQLSYHFIISLAFLFLFDNYTAFKHSTMWSQEVSLENKENGFETETEQGRLNFG